MSDAKFLKKWTQTAIFPSPVCLDGFYGDITLDFNMSFKLLKNLKHFGFGFNEINPGIATKKINKADIITKVIGRNGGRRAPNIGENKL